MANLIVSSSLQTLGVDSTSVSSSNPNRVSLLVQVKSGGTVSIKFDSAVNITTGSVTDGIDVDNTLILDKHCPTGSIHMRGATPNTVVLIQEILRVES